MNKKWSWMVLFVEALSFAIAVLFTGIIFALLVFFMQLLFDLLNTNIAAAAGISVLVLLLLMIFGVREK